jgi:SAM-dependent methyltransferase
MLDRLLHKAVANHRLYDFVQWAAGVNTVRTRLLPLLNGADNQSVLDVGAGTGALRAWLPSNSRYMWMDNDPEKLQGYLSRGAGLAVLGSAFQLGLANKSVDQALFVLVAHHLTDAELRLAFDEIARVVKHKLIFIDPIDCPTRLMSRLLWSIDRGSFPRTPEVLRKFLEESYILEQAEVFTVRHRYFACIAKPRAAMVA